MMPPTKYSPLSSIFLALGLLSTLVNCYDCSQLANQKRCDPNYQGSLDDYPECLVSQFGASAFIQCASQNSAPKLAGTDSDGDPTTVKPLDVLLGALRAPACDECPLAQNIMSLAMNIPPSPNFVDFGAKLCDQIHPIDAGMCCLKKSCLGGTPEHSIKAFCAGDVDDLMKAPLLPNSCVSNAAISGDGSDDSDSSEDTSTAESSSSGQVSMSKTLSPSPGPTKVSTSATTSSTANDAVVTSATSTSKSATGTSPIPQATPNTGAVSGPQVTLLDLLKRLGVVILPILAAF